MIQTDSCSLTRGHVFPGRCPGLLHFKPFGLSELFHQTEGLEVQQLRATPWENVSFSLAACKAARIVVMGITIQFILFLTCLWPAAANAGGQETEKQKMLTELEIIKHAFEVKYAPAEWKKSYIGWDLEEQIELAKSKVLQKKSITTKDFQHIVREFITSSHDHHTKISFYNTEKAYLPFRVHEVNGKYIVSWLRKGLERLADALPSEELRTFLSMPLKVGDEIVEVNGKKTQEVVQELKLKYLGNSKSETHQRLAEMLLTMRLAEVGMDVPMGNVSLTVRHANASKPSKYTLQWFYIPERVKNWASYSSRFSSRGNPFLQRQMWTPYYDLFSPFDEKDEPESKLLGATKSLLPNLGKVKWEYDSHTFDAYIFETDDHRSIGFLRIPNYFGAEKDCEDLEKIISYLQYHSEALVIDQMDNPGGSLFYLFAIVSLLTPTPMDNPTERVTLTQEDVSRAHHNLQIFDVIETEQDIEDIFDRDLEGYHVDMNVVKGLTSHCRFVIDQWEAGRHYSDPEPIFGQEKIFPNPRVNYTHPILILVNNMSFSCGDLLPAIMQDNKRAKIMGTATAGAGGCVLNIHYYNRYGIGPISLTGSMCYRKNQVPLENLGVTPDIIYRITERDLTHDYSDFVKAILKAI